MSKFSDREHLDPNNSTVNNPDTTTKYTIKLTVYSKDSQRKIPFDFGGLNNVTVKKPPVTEVISHRSAPDPLNYSNYFLGYRTILLNLLKTVFTIDIGEGEDFPIEWFKRFSRDGMHVSFKSDHPQYNMVVIQPVGVQLYLSDSADYQTIFTLRGQLDKIKDCLDPNGIWILFDQTNKTKELDIRGICTDNNKLYKEIYIYHDRKQNIMHGSMLTTSRPFYSFFEVISKKYNVQIDFKSQDSTGKLPTITGTIKPYYKDIPHNLLLNVLESDKYAKYIKYYKLGKNKGLIISTESDDWSNEQRRPDRSGPFLSRHDTYYIEDWEIEGIVGRTSGGPVKIYEGKEMPLKVTVKNDENPKIVVHGISRPYYDFFMNTGAVFEGKFWYYENKSKEQVEALISQNIEPVPYKVYMWSLDGHVHRIGDAVIPYLSPYNPRHGFAKNTNYESDFIKIPGDRKGSHPGKPAISEVSNFRRHKDGKLIPTYKRYEGIITEQQLNEAVSRDKNNNIIHAIGIPAPKAVYRKSCGLCGREGHGAINCICPFCYYINLHKPLECPTINPKFRRFLVVPKNVDPKDWPKCTCEIGGICNNCEFLCCEKGILQKQISYCDTHNPMPYHIFYVSSRLGIVQDHGEDSEDAQETSTESEISEGAGEREENLPYFDVMVIGICSGENQKENASIIAGLINDMMYNDVWAVAAHNEKEIDQWLTKAKEVNIIIPEKTKKRFFFNETPEEGVLHDLFFTDEFAVMKSIEDLSDEWKRKIKSALDSIEPRF
jgi:hypothetical protein